MHRRRVLTLSIRRVETQSLLNLTFGLPAISITEITVLEFHCIIPALCHADPPLVQRGVPSVEDVLSLSPQRCCSRKISIKANCWRYWASDYESAGQKLHQHC